MGCKLQEPNRNPLAVGISNPDLCNTKLTQFFLLILTFILINQLGHIQISCFSSSRQSYESNSEKFSINNPNQVLLTPLY